MVVETLNLGEMDRGVSAPDGSTKARIERAALVLFVERGVDGVAVREIAARVGITDAAIYRHFKSKSELAESLMLAIHERLTELVRDIGAQDVSFREKITNLVNDYCALADDDWDLFSYHLLHLHHFPELFVGDSHSPNSGRTRRAGPISACAEMLDAAVDEGEIAPGNIALLASMVLGIVLQAASAKAHMRLRGPLSIYAPEFDKAVWAVLRHR
ncbi:MAG: TetR/AcrR family transcriptional regulator [Robiginitomaculum sp.]|nr:TetR/AcrR family transcriptional regulator [Robiginitomaculum sp.]